MYNFMSLHAIAARRSDGLRPELIRLFQVRAALKAAGVADLQSYNGAGFEQAGPNPVGDAGAGQDNVVPLPADRRQQPGSPAR